jgi:hypothetical protein
MKIFFGRGERMVPYFNVDFTTGGAGGQRGTVAVHTQPAATPKPDEKNRA